MTSRSSTITARAILPMVAGLQELGCDSTAILRESGLDRYDLSDPDVRVPHELMMGFWSAAVGLTGDDCIGIHIAEAAPIDRFELHSFALLASRDLREAWTRAVRYQRLIHDATSLTLEESTREAVLRHSLPGGLSVPRQPAETILALWLRLARMISGQDLNPTLVRFAHAAPEKTNEHERYFRAPIAFSSGVTALVVDVACLGRRNPQADDALANLMERYASRLLADVPSHASLSERARAWISNELRGAAPTARGAAAAMKLSVRSMNRALAEEGTTYRELLDSVRHETASTLLLEGDSSLAEIAFVLGFSELSAFTRAFKRWTGKTPSGYRDSHN